MPASLNIHDILSQVKKLKRGDQLNLLQRLVLLPGKTGVTENSTLRLTSLFRLRQRDMEKHPY